MVSVSELSGDQYEQAYDLLLRYEDSFFPPLREESFGLSEDQDPTQLSDETIVRANLDAIMDRGCRLIGAFEQKELVGVVMVSLSVELESMSGEMSPCAYVFLVVVDDSYRGEGIATSMYHHMVRELLPGSSCGYVAQRVQEPNTASQRLAEKLGFDEFKRLEEPGYTHLYYRRRIDRWLDEMADDDTESV